MHELGNISDAEYQAARAEPDTVHPYQARVEVDAHYAAEMARAWAIEQYGEDAYTRGLTVVTTIDSRKQRAATTALRKALLAYDERHGRSEERTSELQSLMRISSAVFCLQKKKIAKNIQLQTRTL